MSEDEEETSFAWTDYPEVTLCVAFLFSLMCCGFFRRRAVGLTRLPPSPRSPLRLRRTRSYLRLATEGAVGMCAILGTCCVRMYYTIARRSQKSHRDHSLQDCSNSFERQGCCCCPNHQGLVIAYRCSRRITRGMCSDLGQCSRICTYYSFVGILFMGWVGLMVKYQPFFVGGLEDYDKCKDSAFGAMFMFVFTFIVSLIILCNDSMKKRREILRASASISGDSGSSYRDVPTPAIPGLQEYVVDMELPSSNHGSETDLQNLQNRSPYRDNLDAPAAPPVQDLLS